MWNENQILFFLALLSSQLKIKFFFPISDSGLLLSDSLNSTHAMREWGVIVIKSIWTESNKERKSIKNTQVYQTQRGKTLNIIFMGLCFMILLFASGSFCCCLMCPISLEPISKLSSVHLLFCINSLMFSSFHFIFLSYLFCLNNTLVAKLFNFPLTRVSGMLITVFSSIYVRNAWKFFEMIKCYPCDFFTLSHTF
jgi:hypothetical protein